MLLICALLTCIKEIQTSFVQVPYYSIFSNRCTPGVPLFHSSGSFPPLRQPPQIMSAHWGCCPSLNTRWSLVWLKQRRTPALWRERVLFVLISMLCLIVDKIRKRLALLPWEVRGHVSLWNILCTSACSAAVACWAAAHFAAHHDPVFTSSLSSIDLGGFAAKHKHRGLPGLLSVLSRLLWWLWNSWGSVWQRHRAQTSLAGWIVHCWPWPWSFPGLR